MVVKRCCEDKPFSTNGTESGWRQRHKRVVNSMTYGTPRTTGHYYIEIIKGFTIVGILAAVTTVSFLGVLKGSQLTNAADRLVADLRLVRQRAIRDQSNRTLQINAAGRSYQAVDVPDQAGNDSLSVDLSSGPALISSIELFLQGVALDAVTFDPRGKALSYGDIVLNRGSRSVTISIAGGGRIESQ